MIAVLLALGGLAAWAVLASIAIVTRDGYRRIPVDWSRPGVRG